MFTSSDDSFERLKDAVLSIDPVTFCEKNLTLDGTPFRLRNSGYKPFIDIYRYVGVKALEPDGKPIVLVKGRQVGATTMAANLEMYWMGCNLFGTNSRPPMRVMHCFPQLSLAIAYAKTKLDPTISQSRQIPFGHGGRTKGIMEVLMSQGDSLNYKKYQNGNYLFVESTGVDANRLRGRTVDCMIFDEVQDMFKDAISNATKMLNISQWGPSTKGVQIYMGTPKAKGTPYYEMWMKSTQQFYHLGCEKCGNYFPLYTPGTNDWENIWLYGWMVRCPKCEHVQDKREAAENGKWIGTKDVNKCDYIGYHINQLYMPKVTREIMDQQKPGVHPVHTERAWMNEVLGEFYSGDGSTITPEEIADLCSDKDRRQTKRILHTEKKRVYLGADWGQKADPDQASKGEETRTQGQSYSCFVILTVLGPELFNVEFATKLKSNDLEYKMEVIEQAYINYDVALGVGDIGFAYDLTNQLQKKFGDKFLASDAKGDMGVRVKYFDEAVPKVIRFDRDWYIDEVLGIMKHGGFRFPFKDYEKISWLIQHCASMDVQVKLDRYGNSKKHYIKGPTPNDGFMALLNAYLAYKFDISNGFRNTKALFSDEYLEKESKKPLVAGIYLPKMR